MPGRRNARQLLDRLDDLLGSRETRVEGGLGVLVLGVSGEPKMQTETY
jgi:hypothetical protein